MQSQCNVFSTIEILVLEPVLRMIQLSEVVDEEQGRCFIFRLADDSQLVVPRTTVESASCLLENE